MQIDEYTRRIEDKREYPKDCPKDDPNVEWSWNKDEFAWHVSAYDGSIDVCQVQFTGERWLTNGGYRLSSMYQIYQYIDISEPRLDKGASHCESSKLFETLEGVKDYCNDYWKKYLQGKQETVENSKKKLFEFTKFYDKGRPEKLKRLLK